MRSSTERFIFPRTAQIIPRSYANSHIFGGVEALTSEDIIWINLPGVWGVNPLSLYTGVGEGSGWGQAAIYLMLVNGFSHIASAMASRAYNPGLVISVGIFLRLTIAALTLIPAAALQHIVGLILAIAMHGAIIVPLAGKAKALRRGALRS